MAMMGVFLLADIELRSIKSSWEIVGRNAPPESYGEVLSPIEIVQVRLNHSLALALEPSRIGEES